MKYNRVLLKLSGEALMGEKQFGIDNARLAKYAVEVKAVVDRGVQVAEEAIMLSRSATRSAEEQGGPRRTCGRPGRELRENTQGSGTRVCGGEGGGPQVPVRGAAPLFRTRR